MIELKILLDEVDYRSLSEVLIPALAESMAKDGGVLGGMLSQNKELAASMARTVLDKMPQEKKDELLVQLLNRNRDKLLEKGRTLAAEKGVLAGYPVVGLKATLLDGSYHPVDSSEMAFIMAAKLAYKAAMPEAGPVILEPIHTLKAHVPNDNTGDIMGDVTKRRGRVLGMNPDDDGLQVVEAEVPVAEMQDFTTFLRQLTQGRGYFTFEFVRYETLPQMLENKVIEQAKALGNFADED